MKTAVLALLLMFGSIAVYAASSTTPEIQSLQAKAQAGDADAEFALAEAYRAGRGITVDPESAIAWYRRAAAQGHVRASEELGFALFAHGDRREAMPYIEKAAARGEARAFYLLGTAHFNGDYATRDWPLAYAQTMRAATAGLPAAVKNLDLMGHYLLPADKAKADQILATLPAIRINTSAPPAPVAGTSVADSGAQAPAKSAKPAKAMPAVAKAAPPPRTAAPPASGDWKVQLGAFGSADRARDRWKSLAAKVSRLGRYDQRIVAAGSVQRLQAGGIASRADAQALCADVRGARGDCLVIAP